MGRIVSTRECGQERSDDLELEVLLVPVAVGAPLEDADLVVGAPGKAWLERKGGPMPT